MAFSPERFGREFKIMRDRKNSNNPLHYLDNAATTQVPDAVIEAMVTHETRCRANVKRGVHRLAEEANEAYEGAREGVARFLGGGLSDEVIFTSGATAGINYIAQSYGQILQPGDEILISMLEHHSNMIPWQMLKERHGIRLRYLPVTEKGELDLYQLDNYVTTKTRLVAVTHGSNVTGAITDVSHIVDIAHEKGAKVLLDGAQTAPHGPLDLKALDADFYVLSGHKVYGPTGVGVLWGRMSLLESLPPAFGGGEMVNDVGLDNNTYAPPPHRFEAGTPPITQAVGLGAALNWLMDQDLQGMHEHLNRLTGRIMRGLEEMTSGSTSIRILGPPSGCNRLPLVSFAVKGMHPHDICQIMSDRYGVALRGGHHCAQPLHNHYGLDASTRVSLAGFNLQEDVDVFLKGLEGTIKMLG
ncbi:putative cysteine desulfurase [uncultured Desulfobacterium sp.]|uniref:cysteine desulfurase n=1 Tax=uncultured Desulfobacterium sp. TaxID=201089 RepID=A0A445N0Q8_9BACT|nr:putative cysteine desulfurase [uncultured Desulfobacterium sp.]